MKRDLMFESRVFCAFSGAQPVQPMHGVALNYTPQKVGGVIHINPVSSRGAHFNTGMQFNVEAAREFANAVLRLCDRAEEPDAAS